MGITYTEEQQKVIKLHNRDLLVAAAAGAGKTAVLVERIIQMITRKEHPVDIDRLLIVTFTKAAASEMRERIGAAIETQLAKTPSDRHLQRQATLLHNALITTIDSFCLFIIHNNFNDIGLEPDFRVCDDGEKRLLMQDSMNELLENAFQDGKSEFYQFIETFCPDGREKSIEELILSLYRYAQSNPFPTQWLKSCLEVYHLSEIDELDSLSWFQYMKDTTEHILQGLKKQAEYALNLCHGIAGPLAYAETIQDDLNLIDTLLTAKDFEQIQKIMSLMKFMDLSRKKGKEEDESLRNIVKGNRNFIKEELKKLQKDFYSQTKEKIWEDIKQNASVMEILISLTQQFDVIFTEKKRDRRIIDFNDMEHMALRILLKEDGGIYVPTQAALEYRDFFEEIMTDEYQDSNMVQEYILKSIAREEKGKRNRFMVGDVKQSIYKFRLARPEIFMQKYNTFQRTDSESQIVELSGNFRSRKEIIDSVNSVFYRIMHKSLGNVQYDDKAALYYGANYPDTVDDHKTELCLLDSEEDQDKKNTEAAYIATRIRQMVGTFKVTNKDGSLRLAKYSDIAILLRTLAGWEDRFKAELESAGIPVVINSREGYFTTGEVQNLINMMKIINNPYQDIPFYGVLISVLGNFSEREIASIKQKNKHLYTSLLEANSSEKVERFLRKLHEYREKSTYLPIHELLLQIIRDNNYLELVGAQPQGAQKVANVNILIERAINYGETSYRGLFHFVRYIEQIVKYEIDCGEADLSDENADAVRIITIHKSKGLEFPICFVAGMQKEFNFQDIRQPLLLDVNMGIAAKTYYLKERFYKESVYRNAMEGFDKEEIIGEELRVLYVAMTRAREKLIMTAVAGKMEEKVNKIISQIPDDNNVGYVNLRSSKSYLELIIMAIQTGAREYIEMKFLNATAIGQAKLMDVIDRQFLKEELQREAILRQNLELKSDLAEELERRFSRIYPHENLASLYIKTTVSEIKMAAMEKLDAPDPDIKLIEPEKMTPYVPSFIEAKKEVSGTTRGTAYHRILELLDCDRINEKSDILIQMQEMAEQHKIENAYINMVSTDKLYQFTRSNLYGRMTVASHRHALFREQPFVLGMKASEVNDNFPKEEMILIQGIIDVFFEEEDGLVLVDYKTDRVSNQQDLILRYQAQMDYYKRALEQLTGKRVKEVIIYSFGLECEIPL